VHVAFSYPRNRRCYNFITGALRRTCEVNLRTSTPASAAAEEDAKATSDCSCNQAGGQQLRCRPVEGRSGPADSGRQVRQRRCLSGAAMERERSRARRLNDAFERLRRVLPTSCAHDQHRRLSKIATLRLAINYLGALTTLLGCRQTSTLSDKHLDAQWRVAGCHTPLTTKIL